MELNHNCIREILLVVQRETEILFDETTLHDYSIEEITYHVKYCDKLGCFDNAEYFLDNTCYVDSLSPYGHSILKQIKDDTTFQKIKKFLIEKGLPFALDTIREALKYLSF